MRDSPDQDSNQGENALNYRKCFIAYSIRLRLASRPLKNETLCVREVPVPMARVRRGKQDDAMDALVYLILGVAGEGLRIRRFITSDTCGKCCKGDENVGWAFLTSTMGVGSCVR